MVDEIMLAIASALAGKAADAVADSARETWGRLVRLVRDRFRGDERGTTVLAAARGRPGDSDAVHELAGVLAQAAAADQKFGADLRALWLTVGPQLSAAGGSVINVVTGTAGGHVIQTRDLHVEGGIHLGDTHGPAAS
jgi:hypothetical protein